MRGTQIMVSGSVRASTTTVRRTGVDARRAARPALPAAAATAHDVMQPLQWPIGPGAFLGISSDLGGDRFTIGFATYMPYVQQITSRSRGRHRADALPGDADLRNLALVPALSIRFGDDFRVGIAPGFLFSTGRLSFAEQTVPGGESPAAERATT